MSTERLNWGIIGAGRIAGTFVQGLASSQTGTLVAVGSRDEAKARKFAKEHKVDVATHGSYEALLADDNVQAVYVATPHPMHAEWVVKAAEAGKHILTEKPAAVNAAQAEAMIEAAIRHDVFFMEAFMYRCSPQTAALLTLIANGAIGEVRAIQATFSFQAQFNAEGRLFKNDLAGGGILDVGCYPVSLSRLIAGAASGTEFMDPISVRGQGHLGETAVDEWAAAVLKFPNEIVAQVATGIRVGQENAARIYGSDGWILVPNPFVPAREGGETTMVLHRKGAEPEDVVVKSDRHLFSYETDMVARYLDDREPAPPAMTWDDTLGNMRTLDAWRADIGLQYDMEKDDAAWPTIHRRPLKKRADADIARGQVPGLEKPVSRLVMGQDNQKSLAPASILWDEFVERGGNAFDTAWQYAGGRCEEVLGLWLANRGIRDQLVILDKGAHTPNCTPQALTQQLLTSLERLQTEYLDIYMMHRDNTEVPVGEFVDVMNEHQKAGRMTVFGVSNWTLERIKQFNAYAEKHGLSKLSAISNNFSLARMVEPVWTGCIAASEPELKQWHTETNYPLMPWSSQARGFFTERSNPENRDQDPSLVQCWCSEDNYERKRRAAQLAQEKDASTIQIALAYVLNQPFPTFPLIGPRSIAELSSSCGAFEIDLSPEEVAWLNLERDER